MVETRKIAVIFAADVVGYGRLTSADEDRTLARLRALRSDLIDPTIAVHHGRVVKRTGDGAFRSVVEAVRCAIEVQRSMIERNAGVLLDRRIDLRIGIHLGDIIEESDGDLMGDGVNIAARLEGIAKPGANFSGPFALPDKPSIAVLPFQNMSGDPGQEYCADGMAEEIITALSRFSQLFVSRAIQRLPIRAERST
jgi:adenylate cyclase